MSCRQAGSSGIEALARFPGGPKRAPNVWFDEATEIGLGTELQVAAVQLALPAIDLLPPDVYVSVNVDPAAASPELAECCSDGRPSAS